MSHPAPPDPARSRLQAAGLRLTRARLAILHALLKRDRPASVDDIHRELESGRCDRVTVYRCLAAMAEAGVVRLALHSGGADRYEAASGTAPRYRVVCRKTGRIEDLDPAGSAELARALAAAEEGLRARGYTAVVHRLEFGGIAPTPES
jgi:Fe2+ or Zn2+ uptake regulation protein